MVAQTRIRFGEIYLLVGNGATPTEVFTSPCGISTFGRSVTTNTSDVELMDCATPDAPIWLGVDVTSKRMTLTFSGTLDKAAYGTVWKDWAMDEASKNIRVYENLTGSVGYWSGAGVLTEYSDTANGRGSYTMTGTVVFDGKPVWTAVP